MILVSNVLKLVSKYFPVHKLQLAQARWVATGEKEGLDVPKGHAVHRILVFVFLWGAIDKVRLNNFEHDHTAWSKMLFDVRECT